MDFVYSIDGAAFSYLARGDHDADVETEVSTDLSHWQYVSPYGPDSYPIPHEWIDTEEDLSAVAPPGFLE